MKEVIRAVVHFARAQYVCAVLSLAVASLLVPQSQPITTGTSKPNFSKARKLIQQRIVAESIPSVSVQGEPA